MRLNAVDDASLHQKAQVKAGHVMAHYPHLVRVIPAPLARQFTFYGAIEFIEQERLINF